MEIYQYVVIFVEVFTIYFIITHFRATFGSPPFWFEEAFEEGKDILGGKRYFEREGGI